MAFWGDVAVEFCRNQKGILFVIIPTPMLGFGVFFFFCEGLGFRVEGDLGFKGGRTSIALSPTRGPGKHRGIQSRRFVGPLRALIQQIEHKAALSSQIPPVSWHSNFPQRHNPRVSPGVATQTKQT